MEKRLYPVVWEAGVGVEEPGGQPDADRPFADRDCSVQMGTIVEDLDIPEGSGRVRTVVVDLGTSGPPVLADLQV
jgi:hypothetical protein